MFIFARRALQACLDTLSLTLARDQVLLAERPNMLGADRLAAMWEVVLLAGIARATSLAHEAALPNGRQPVFTANLGGDNCVGDITTVSDAGLRDLSPVAFLNAEIARLARKHGLIPNHLSARIEGARFDEGAQLRARLSLLYKPDLTRLLNREIDAFVRDIRRTGNPTAEFKHDEGGSRFTIGYDTSQKYMRGAYRRRRWRPHGLTIVVSRRSTIALERGPGLGLPAGLRPDTSGPADCPPR